MKNFIRIPFSLFFIAVIFYSCSTEDINTTDLAESFYKSADISIIEEKMGGTFYPLINETRIKQNLINEVEIDFNTIDYKKSFMLENFNNNIGLNLYFISQKDESPFYFLQKSDMTINVSELVRRAKYEITHNINSNSKKAEESWGDCYKRVKARMTELVEEDGENLAICDGLNYLGLCDAAIASASATICTRDTLID